MRIVVIEDEEVAADRLCRLTRKILGERQASIRVLPTLASAAEHLVSRSVDLVFLDLNLQGRDGFRVLEQAVAGSFQTIVVSAQHDQALRAFEFGVLDFVAKPYDEQRLRKALDRLASAGALPAQRLKYLAVRRGTEVVPVAIDDVLFIKGADDYSEIHRRDGTRVLHGKTLSALEKLLPQRFERVHRSYIVDTAAIESISGGAGGRYTVRLAAGGEVPVSRSRIARLRDRFG